MDDVEAAYAKIWRALEHGVAVVCEEVLSQQGLELGPRHVDSFREVETSYTKVRQRWRVGEEVELVVEEGLNTVWGSDGKILKERKARAHACEVDVAWVGDEHVHASPALGYCSQLSHNFVRWVELPVLLFVAAWAAYGYIQGMCTGLFEPQVKEGDLSFVVLSLECKGKRCPKFGIVPGDGSP